MANNLSRLRVALGTGLGRPATVEVDEAERDALQTMTLDQAIRFFLKKAKGYATTQDLRGILERGSQYAAQVNDRNNVRPSQKMADLLPPGNAQASSEPSASGGPVGPQLNIKIAERIEGGCARVD